MTKPKLTRREFIFDLFRKLLLLLLGGFAFANIFKSSKAGYVWQIDPKKCVKCGRCATACVLTPSAVKCTHQYDIFEYSIDKSRCMGCGKCVKGCNLFGNGSLYLQVQHDLCKNCNDCSIARVCAGKAYVRVPAQKAYFKKHA